MIRRSLRLLGTLLVLTLASCTLHSTATHWNGRVGENGRPVFVKVTTNVGFNFLILLPVIGRVTIDEMIDTATSEIAAEKGDNIRIFQTTNENYWYGFPPLTWFVTPVITNVSMQYTPSTEELEKVREEQQKLRRVDYSEADWGTASSQ